MDFQKMFLGIKPKKAVGVLQKGLKPLNLAQADRHYKKKNIVYNSKFDDYSATYEIKHTLATKYNGPFTASAYFSRDRRVLKEKNGKVTKWGPWTYWGKVSAIFENLPMKDYTQTQAKLKELYPQFQFGFYKTSVEVYLCRDLKNLKDMEKLMADFNSAYKRASNDLVDGLNYAFKTIHKK